MSVLMLAGEILGRPVVTFAGEDVAQVKDVVYAAGGGRVAGFTLNGRGLFAGPLKTSLPWRHVAGMGSDAVMVEDEQRLTPLEELLADADGAASGGAQRGGAPEAGDVLGSRVLTDAGVDLGKVVDVVIEVADDRRGSAEVVGYEVEPSEALGNVGKKVLIPLPDTIAASGEHLIVPSGAKDFVRRDLAGFGAAVQAFRAQLHGTGR